MKTKEELNALKEELEALNRKLSDLSEEELAQISGGFIPPLPPCGCDQFKPAFDGSGKVVDLNIDPNPASEWYNSSGLIS